MTPRTFSFLRPGLLILAFVSLSAVCGFAQQASQESAPSPPPPGDDQAETTAQETRNLTPLEAESEALHAEVLSLRKQLAQCLLEASQASRELDELRQFVADHHQLGQDFEQYRAVKAVAEEEARRRAAEIARTQRETERATQAEKRRQARAERAKREAIEQRVARYRKAGFSPVGLEVYTSRMAFAYETKDVTRTSYDYDPFLGTFLRVPEVETEIDYSKMTISGSVLNATGELRNVGIAITFFDNHGNQVGHEIIQINNARPDVPYPFTSTIDMALNRAFHSSSTYVLYADPVEEETSTP